MHIMFLQNEANQEGGYKACAPSFPEMTCCFYKFVYPTSLLHHSLVVHPLLRKLRYEEIKEGKIGNVQARFLGDFWSFFTRKNGCLYKKLRFYKCNCIQLEYQSILIPDVIAGHSVSQALLQLFFKNKYFQCFEGIYHTLDKSLAVLHF